MLNHCLFVAYVSVQLISSCWLRNELIKCPQTVVGRISFPSSHVNSDDEIRPATFCR